jgi:hypothetical protein
VAVREDVRHSELIVTDILDSDQLPMRIRILDAAARRSLSFSLSLSTLETLQSG